MPKSQVHIKIGEAFFDPATGEVEHSGNVTGLRPQTTRFLTELIDNAGIVISKGDLLDRIWPDTHVTEDSLVQCASEIRKALRGVSGVAL